MLQPEKEGGAGGERCGLAPALGDVPSAYCFVSPPTFRYRAHSLLWPAVTVGLTVLVVSKSDQCAAEGGHMLRLAKEMTLCRVPSSSLNIHIPHPGSWSSSRPLVLAIFPQVP